jgi:hypothetical protein
MFNTIPSELISIISDYPLTDPIFQNPVFCSNLISLKTTNMLAIQSYIADIDASAFNRLANLFNDITQEDIMKIANKINLEAIEGLRDIPVQVSSFALNDLPLIILLENLPRAIINDVFSLSQTVFKDLTAHYVDEGIQQLSSMASNTWRWLDSFTNETIFSTGSTKITKTILTNLIEIDQDILLKYKSNRLAYDPQNYLGALSTSTILELSNQKIYKDLSKLATVTDTLPSVCAAFLNYADRSTISDSIFKNQTTLAELLGVSASLFTGMDWIALKSLCKLSDASLNNIKNTAGAKDALHIVCKYNINMIRTLCANPSSQYLVSSLNIDYEYIIDMLTKPDMASSPTMLMNISPAKDILALDDSLFNDMLTIINNNISHASKISLMSLTNNAKWIAITQFVAIAKFDILKAIADLDSTIYAQIKTITDAQFAGIHNLLEVGAVSLDIKMDSTTHINAVLDVFKLIDPEDIEIYGFIKPSLPMIKDIDKNRLNMLFSITYNVAALLTYNTFITNPSITNAVKYNANLTHIFKALTLIPTNKKPKVFSSYYLMLINKLTLAQIQNMDKNMASIMSTLGVLDMSEVFEDARYGMLNGLTDSEIDSLSEMSESNLNIFKNDIANSIIKIDSSDYSIFSVDNFGSLSKIEVENYPLIVEV